jgi:hypothetical protein
MASMNHPPSVYTQARLNQAKQPYLIIREIRKITELAGILHDSTNHHFISLLKQMKGKTRERKESIIVIEYWKNS